MTPAYAGRWNVARSIFDDERQTSIDCSGSAMLDVENESVAYAEVVAFPLAGKFIRATRAYRFQSSNGVIVATFADGAPFFKLQLDSDGIGTAVHDCGEDRYSLVLTLREPATWQTRWTISGTKRLQIITRYIR